MIKNALSLLFFFTMASIFSIIIIRGNMYKYIIIASIVVLLLIFINTTFFKGKYGELKVNNFLKRLVKKDGIVVKDVIIKEGSVSSQIDHIIISKKGVFSVETKNYAGTIYGDDKRKEWVQVFNYGKQKYSFYSPCLQNKTHIKVLNEVIGKDIFIYNVVIFYNNSISNIDSKYVYTKSSFKKFYKSLECIYDDKFIHSVYNKLIDHGINTISLKEHIESKKNR